MRLIRSSFIAAGLLSPSIGYAQSINISGCPIAGIACPTNFLGYVQTIIGSYGGTAGIISAFIGILSAMLIYYGFKLLLNADNDSTTGEVKSAYGHAITGAIVVGASALLANTFASGNQSVVIQSDVGNSVLFYVVATFKSIVYIALVFNLSFQGIRLVVHQDESQADKAKKQFMYGMIGAAIVILADAMVTAFSGRNITIINEQTRGIIEFLLTILGGLAVIGILVSGIFLVLSVDEQLKDRAKKAILASIVVLALVVLSLSILLVFAAAPFSS